VPSRPGTLIAGHYIGEVLRGQLARASTTTSRSTRKTCFLGRSNSFGQFTGIVRRNGEKQEQQKEEEKEKEKEEIPGEARKGENGGGRAPSKKGGKRAWKRRKRRSSPELSTDGM